MEGGEEGEKKQFPRVYSKEKALSTVCPYANVGQMILMLSAQSGSGSLSVAVK